MAVSRGALEGAGLLLIRTLRRLHSVVDVGDDTNAFWTSRQHSRSDVEPNCPGLLSKELNSSYYKRDTYINSPFPLLIQATPLVKTSSPKSKMV